MEITPIPSFSVSNKFDLFACVVDGSAILIPFIGLVLGCVVFQVMRGCKSDRGMQELATIHSNPSYNINFNENLTSNSASIIVADYPPVYCDANRRGRKVRELWRGRSQPHADIKISLAETVPDDSWRIKDPVGYRAHVIGMIWQQTHLPSTEPFLSSLQILEVNTKGYDAWRIVQLESESSAKTQNYINAREVNHPFGNSRNKVCLKNIQRNDFEIEVTDLEDDNENTPLAELMKLTNNNVTCQMYTISEINNFDEILLSSSRSEHEKILEPVVSEGVQGCSTFMTFASLNPLTFDPANRSRPFHYFEVKIVRIGRRQSSDLASKIAIGFTTIPYPPKRCIGFHRYSIGLHSDSGRIFQNDGRGVNLFEGIPFTNPFQENDTVIGCGYDPSRGSFFFTRNGYVIGDSVQAITNLKIHNNQGKMNTLKYTNKSWIPMAKPFHAAISVNCPSLFQVNFGQNAFQYIEANAPLPIVNVGGTRVEALPKYM
ncbi:Rsp5p-dependent ubiquitination, sorting of cargo proteins at the multivesicular body [Nowakowskiella sp. JEL0078]|nr:Rsp5p-dependent ubiquitination, sorting of cargo proteins at the multivesicular body [Nowakowskiella sp. JEL0078]